MFDNVGNKIKIFAQVLCWICIVLAIGAGIYVLIFMDIVLGLVIMVAGAFLVWFVSLLLYGFGALVESREKDSTRMDEIIARFNEMKSSKDE